MTGSTLAPTILFIITVGAVAGLGIAGATRVGRAMIVAVGIAIWLAATGALAGAGLLRDFTRVPPPIIVLAAVSGLITIGLALSPLGARLSAGVSLAWLVGFQAFRIAVEVALAQLFHAGVIPVQMTFEGRNFDILSGITALAVAWLAARGRLPTWGLLLWNLLGLGLLVNIVVIAVLSTPVPFRAFLNPPANTIIAELPFVWLPAFLVQAALLGHLLVFRRILAGPRAA